MFGRSILSSVEPIVGHKVAPNIVFNEPLEKGQFISSEMKTIEYTYSTEVYNDVYNSCVDYR